MDSAEEIDWWALYILEAEEMEAVRTGTPRPAPASAPLSQTELERKIKRVFGVAA